MRIRSTTWLPADDVRLVDGVRVTTVARTLCDLAGVVARNRLRLALEAAITEQRVSAPQVQACAAAWCRRGRCGSGLIRALDHELLDDEPLAASELERRAARLLRAAGISGWTAQYRPPRFDGVRGVVDLAWPAERVAVELDGRRWHATRSWAERPDQPPNATTLRYRPVAGRSVAEPAGVATWLGPDVNNSFSSPPIDDLSFANGATAGHHRVRADRELAPARRPAERRAPPRCLRAGVPLGRCAHGRGQGRPPGAGPPVGGPLHVRRGQLGPRRLLPPVYPHQWLLADVRCHGLVGGRGLSVGNLFDTDGTHTLTIVQEVVLRQRRRPEGGEGGLGGKDG